MSGDLTERAQVAQHLGMVVGWVDYEYHAGAISCEMNGRRISGAGVLWRHEPTPSDNEPPLLVDMTYVTEREIARAAGNSNGDGCE